MITADFEKTMSKNTQPPKQLGDLSWVDVALLADAQRRLMSERDLRGHPQHRQQSCENQHASHGSPHLAAANSMTSLTAVFSLGSNFVLTSSRKNC